VIFGYSTAWIGVRKTQSGLRLSLTVCADAKSGGREQEVAGVNFESTLVYLRVAVGEGGKCRFSYSLDGRAFVPMGADFTASKGRWMGAKVGLFALARPDAEATGHADFDWFRVGRP
jgi:hypothetical protein